MSKELQPTNFTEGKILGPLIRFALPVLGALFLQATYGAVDLLIVGQFASSVDVRTAPNAGCTYCPTGATAVAPYTAPDS